MDELTDPWLYRWMMCAGCSLMRISKVAVNAGEPFPSAEVPTCGFCYHKRTVNPADFDLPSSPNRHRSVALELEKYITLEIKCLTRNRVGTSSARYRTVKHRVQNLASEENRHLVIC